ncbi:hypothetical protein V6380_16435 [Acinetobacter variabilis]|uniref:hypothetical protein n=1 Tax=Acinetobacter variabilis TaxID=70346 RepID=UPI003B83DD7D
MNMTSPNREAAIKHLNECYQDISEAVCNEQALQIDCFIRGFAKASVVLNAMSECELNQILNSLNATPPVKPSFLDVPEKQLTRSDAMRTVKAKAQTDGRSLDSALDCLNELTTQGFEFPTALSLVLDEYQVDQDELTNAYDEQ